MRDASRIKSDSVSFNSVECVSASDFEPFPGAAATGPVEVPESQAFETHHFLTRSFRAGYSTAFAGGARTAPSFVDQLAEVFVQLGFPVVFIYLMVSAGIVGLALWLGRFLRPHIPDAQKASTYECGERPIGSAWFNFNPRFYLFALIFIVFDAEIALTYPVAVVVKSWVISKRAGMALFEMILFLAILVAALAYIWGKGELDWSRDLITPEEEESTERMTEEERVAVAREMM